MSIEGIPDGQNVVPGIVPEPVDPVRQRIRDMVAMDVFLGPPYGQRHGDEWSIGGVQPRWPRVREPLPEPTGPVIGRYTINFETGEIEYESFLPKAEGPDDDAVIINDDGTFTAPPAPEKPEPDTTER